MTGRRRREQVGFAAADALAGLKLQERGLHKEGLAVLGVLVTPVALLVPALVARYTHGERPLDVFAQAYPYRLAVGLLLAGLVWSVPYHVTDGAASPPLYAAMLACFVAHQAGPRVAGPASSPTSRQARMSASSTGHPPSSLAHPLSSQTRGAPSGPESRAEAQVARSGISTARVAAWRAVRPEAGAAH